ncbi:uncharacterized protein TNCV_4244211 [Trichonephila clavipes]|nr:uncharacterized protein TNCV_4244211 [Trichonephila clavipes]
MSQGHNNEAILPSPCIRKAWSGCSQAKRLLFWTSILGSRAKEKNRPDNINHVMSCLKRFARDTKDYWAFLDQEGEEIVAEEEKHVCECRHFPSIPRNMQGHPRVREGFYESVLEKPDMWEELITFNDSSGSGKDVCGIIRLYARGDWVWFHIMVKHDVF